MVSVRAYALKVFIMMVAVLTQYLAAHLYYHRCDRTLLHVLFASQSKYCTTLHSLNQGIQTSATTVFWKATQQALESASGLIFRLQD